MFGLRLTLVQCENIFHVVDTNTDSFMTFAEFFQTVCVLKSLEKRCLVDLSFSRQCFQIESMPSSSAQEEPKYKDNNGVNTVLHLQDGKSKAWNLFLDTLDATFPHASDEEKVMSLVEQIGGNKTPESEEIARAYLSLDVSIATDALQDGITTMTDTSTEISTKAPISFNEFVLAVRKVRFERMLLTRYSTIVDHGLLTAKELPKFDYRNFSSEDVIYMCSERVAARLMKDLKRDCTSFSAVGDGVAISNLIDKLKNIIYEEQQWLDPSSYAETFASKGTAF